MTNTKFDISYCVFRESFMGDQYRIREFLEKANEDSSLLFLDIGRNHGLIFYYTLYWMMKKGVLIKKIDYIGIDPSPLKFVYFNFFKFLSGKGIDVHYRLIDKAVVFDDSKTVELKYGEKNFGNFNVSSSNYEHNLEVIQSKFSFVDIEVDTIDASELMQLTRDAANYGQVIVKIDCKNQTEILFSNFIDSLSGKGVKNLVACEADESGGKELLKYRMTDSNTLVRLDY